MKMRFLREGRGLGEGISVGKERGIGNGRKKGDRCSGKRKEETSGMVVKKYADKSGGVFLP